MRTEILAIGSELTGGVTVNTNAAYLARRLAEAGCVCERQVVVRDDRALIIPAVREALSRCELLVTTGGLGPTFDDITMEAIAQATGRPLAFRPDAARTVRRFYTKRHRRLQAAALRQARLPRGGLALANPVGTAPGLWLDLSSRIIVALPGVPAEMRAILNASVMPRLRRLQAQPVASVVLRTIGVLELEIQRRLRRLRLPPTLEIGLYPNLRMVDVRLTVRRASRRLAERTLARSAARLRRALGDAVYGAGGQTLEAVVGERLARQHVSLAVAESCTGGLVSTLLTDVPGSSRYLRGAVVAYHNHFKQGPLGVPAALLKRHGAVSAPAARAMAQGVRRLAAADIGLAITGIAGPGGATPGKPVGLVYVGLATPRRSQALRCQFYGDRPAIKRQAAQTALDWLRRAL